MQLPGDLTILAHLTQSDSLGVQSAGLCFPFACHLHFQRDLEQLADEALLAGIDGQAPQSQRMVFPLLQPDWANKVRVAVPFQLFWANSNS